MIFTYFTMMIGIFISFISAYYSVAGLANIFTGSFWSIIIMGTALEIGKITATLWLHKYWNQGRWWLKTYLSIAVIVLMFITSMGIFGGLSKAHIEQTSASQESVAQVKRLEGEIGRQTAIVERAENRIKQLESGGGGADANIQGQIDSEQKRIDAAYTRIQPQIDEQNRIIEGQSKLFSDQIAKIDSDLEQLQRYIDDKEVGKAQALVGIKVDNDWGPGTGRSVTAWKARKAQERNTLVNKIQDINRDNSNIQAARDEVVRLRKSVEPQIVESNKIISRLREQVGKNKSEDIDGALKEQQTALKSAQSELDVITKQKYTLEGEYRKLEAEVGPIKYIAEFIYGEESDKNMLERAVRWVIITIIFVFDPLAVLLLLASQYSFEYHRRETPVEERKTLEELLSATPEIGPIVESTDEQTKITTPDETAQAHAALDELEQKLFKVQHERDLLFRAHNHEMERADYLAFQLSEIAAKPKIAELLSMPELDETVVEEVVKQPEKFLEDAYDEITVDSDVIIGDQPEAKATSNEIKTYGVTNQAIFYHPEEEYVNFEGKQISINALKGLRPDLLLSPGDPINQILFGNTFPAYSKIGDMYIRTDVMPHVPFKFNGNKWIEVDKSLSGSYLQYIPYVQYLIQKIETGEYDAEYLTDDEREEIERHLSSK